MCRVQQFSARSSALPRLRSPHFSPTILWAYFSPFPCARALRLGCLFPLRKPRTSFFPTGKSRVSLSLLRFRRIPIYTFCFAYLFSSLPSTANFPPPWLEGRFPSCSFAIILTFSSLGSILSSMSPPHSCSFPFLVSLTGRWSRLVFLFFSDFLYEFPTNELRNALLLPLK